MSVSVLVWLCSLLFVFMPVGVLYVWVCVGCVCAGVCVCVCVCVCVVCWSMSMYFRDFVYANVLHVPRLVLDDLRMAYD